MHIPERNIGDIGLTQSDQERVTRLLDSFGVRPEEHGHYLAEVVGMVDVALDSYLREVRDGMMGP